MLELEVKSETWYLMECLTLSVWDFIIFFLHEKYALAVIIFNISLTRFRKYINQIMILSISAVHFEDCGVHKSMNNIFWYNILLLKLLKNQKLFLVSGECKCCTICYICL